MTSLNVIGSEDRNSEICDGKWNTDLDYNFLTLKVWKIDIRNDMVNITYENDASS